MNIAWVKVIFHLPACFSLKEKRRRILSLKERIKTKFSTSVAEIDYQDSLKTSAIGVVLVNSKRQVLERELQKILGFIQEKKDIQIVDCQYGVEKV